MKKLILLFTALLFLYSCREDQPVPMECEEGNFLLSDLITHTNHFLPFTLCNDSDEPLRKLILNDEELNPAYGNQIGFEESGFFTLVLDYESAVDDTILFSLISQERDHAEWAIPEWIPEAETAGVLPECEILSVYPRHFVIGTSVPFIFYLMENGEKVDGYYNGEASEDSKLFSIKHGQGSVTLNMDGTDEIQQFIIGTEPVSLSMEIFPEMPQLLSGELTGDLEIAENSLSRINGDLHVPSGASLLINAGAVIIIDEGINILNEGDITINGSPDNPVFITCTDSNKYWGGFISNGPSGNMNASHTIFCRSGYHNTGIYTNWGHAQRQALFYTSNSALDLDHCYIIDHIGQIFYPLNSVLNLESILIQRVKTGGQLNYSVVSIDNSIFTDFPDDSRIYRDEDNDALYINASDVTITNSYFMFAKDDGMDSGLNEGGTVTVTNCHFEACFHEGAALSSQNEVVKNHIFNGCTFYNCGQGIELGFSSPNHTVYVNNCLFVNNGIGIRYGDNYDWSVVSGHMYINDSQSLNNKKDVWNMVRKSWAPKLDHMHFDNVQVSAFCPQYPSLQIAPE